MYFRLVAHFHDGRTKVYPPDPPGYFSVGESPYGIPSGYYAVYFFTEQHRPMPHHNQAIQINFQSEVTRASQSQLSLHQAGTRSGERPLLGSGSTVQPPLNSPAAVPPARALAASAPTPPDSGSEESVDTVEDAGLEFRKYTYAMDLEDRQQEFIKNSAYVTEVGEVFALNRIMRRELMELQRVIVLNSQQAHKEVAQVKGTVHDLLQIQREVLANAAENISRPAPTPPDYVGLGHAALATIREIGVALVQRSESRPSARPSERTADSPQLPAVSAPSNEAPSVPSGPGPDVLDKMVSKLRTTTDYDIALAMSSPSQWKAFLEGLLSKGKEESTKPPEPTKGDEKTGS